MKNIQRLFQVTKGLDTLLFKLLVLRSIKDLNGNVWRRRSSDMYVVEITTDNSFSHLTKDEIPNDESRRQVCSIFFVFPEKKNREVSG